MNSSMIDRTGVTISALCLIHCLVLPMAMTALPLIGVMAENENIHKILVLLAVVPAFIAFVPAQPSKIGNVIRSVGGLGVLCLLCGAFIEPLHNYEKQLTVIGALALAFAHVSRMLADRHHRHLN